MERTDIEFLAIAEKYYSKTTIQAAYRCKLCRQIIYTPNLFAHLAHKHLRVAKKYNLDPNKYRYFGT